MLGILRFFRNIYTFRGILMSHSVGTQDCLLATIKTSLEIMENNLYATKGTEERIKKKMLSRIHRSLEILERIEDNEYLAIAESELGDLIYNESLQLTHEEKQHNMKVIKRASTLERNEWEELWDILKGQDISKMRDFKKEFDGTGLKNWIL